MSDLFLSIINLSLTASWLILAVIILRLLLKKAPKWITCVLWTMVAIRLICPFSIKSALSLIPSSEPISHDIVMDRTPSIDSGVKTLDNIINPILADNFTPDLGSSANPLQVYIPILSVLWSIGIVFMISYAVISFVKLRKSVGASITVDEHVLVCDEVKSPFILGVFKPVIYVPSYLDGESLDCVIKHERTHIKRGDHLWKPLGYLLLSAYWFNPLCWLAYILLCRDIELACDERVVRDMDNTGKIAYSQALLRCSFPRRRIVVCPLAFGEIGVKERVKAVLNYKKPGFWIVFAAVASCVVVCVCFMTNPKTDAGNNAVRVGKYVCEIPGVGGDFSIVINADGTFQYYEGAISSYIGTGRWTYNDDKITLKDEGLQSSIREYHFDYEDGILIFRKNDSSEFTYVKAEDKTRFFLLQNDQDHIFSVNDGMPDSDNKQVDNTDNNKISGYGEEQLQNSGVLFSDITYDFGEFSVEPRWYQFDGEQLYFAYDLLDCKNTSDVSVNVANEDIETVYYVSNDYNPDRIVMWAIIHFDEYRDSVNLAISSPGYDKIYSENLYIN